ncbi:MAG: hypothetical protein K2Y71_22090 [Xanthobacteraceae bacterium]|nr:hypothetical protein [Xanthobacteraceae bacterium]
MVTVGDIEMESPQTKIFSLSNSLLIMPSDDDAAFHMEIMNDVSTTIHARINADRDRWWTVQEAVDVYVSCVEEHRAKRSERSILKPLGLDRYSWHISVSPDSELGKQIASDLVNFKIPFLSVIIVGIDPNGPHINVVETSEYGQIDTGCYDSIGFAAIGAGGRHARAEFLAAGHTYRTPLPEALWNVYLAKKRSEVAPGVGSATDMYMMGPTLGFGTTIRTEITDELERQYVITRAKEEAARQTAAKDMTTYVETITQESQQQQIQTSVTDTGEPIETPNEPAEGIEHKPQES